ncbi:MAG: Gfo/Idh/MocA family oxidoreductase [Candidatus Bathyarchaeota archaeon]|nr:Gfo/Idh/MocA family oxidoreductase [Candidatus Bathyarchaeota archaeon]
MLKGCVIGLGAMGSNHVRVLRELQEEGKTELIGVADIRENLAREVAETYGVDWFTDYKRLLEEKPDFVIVAVPTKLHRKVAEDAVKKGCHILVEKPIAHTVSEARKIVEIVERKGVQLMVGHIERFNPVVQEMKERIGRETVHLIGTVRVGPPIPSERVDTGVILDLAVHDIDIIRYLTQSEFKQISAFTADRESGIEESAMLSFEMENGALVYIITNRITPLKIRGIEVTTDQKFIRGDLISQKVTEYSKGELITHARRSMFVTEIDIPYMEPLKLELKAFLSSLEQAKKPPVSGEDGLRALEIAVKCIRQFRK